MDYTLSARCFPLALFEEKMTFCGGASMASKYNAWFVIVLIIVTMYPSGETACAQVISTTAPHKSFGPITNYDTALKDSSDPNRLRKSARYNINGQAPILSDKSEQNLFELPRSHSHNSVSVSDYDTVVIGTVIAGQSYLSGDKRNIYSEFKVTLGEIVKAAVRPLSVGQSIDVERDGGTIRLPSGKILRRGSLAESMPEISKRYVFILQYVPDTDSFILKTGYQLERQHVYCLDDSRKNITVNQSLKEYGTTEDQFIEEIKKSVSAEKGEN
jgi:hypothetical protein